MNSPIRILLAEDHAIMREGLRALLECHDRLAVVGEAMDGREALSLVRELAPQLVIMDIDMPNLNGIEATRQILSAFPQIRIIGLSVHTQSRSVTEIIEAGAAGYVPKKCASEELVNAIDEVMAGKMYVSPEVTSHVVGCFAQARRETEGKQPHALSAREREVVQLLAEGKSVKEIAAMLCISTPTVHTHRQNIFRKLGAHSLAELTKYAIREGLTSLES